MNDRIGYWLFEKHRTATDVATLVLSLTSVVCLAIVLVWGS